MTYKRRRWNVNSVFLIPKSQLLSTRPEPEAAKAQGRCDHGLTYLWVCNTEERKDWLHLKSEFPNPSVPENHLRNVFLKNTLSACGPLGPVTRWPQQIFKLFDFSSAYCFSLLFVSNLLCGSVNKNLTSVNLSHRHGESLLKFFLLSWFCIMWSQQSPQSIQPSKPRLIISTEISNKKPPNT